MNLKIHERRNEQDKERSNNETIQQTNEEKNKHYETKKEIISKVKIDDEDTNIGK